MVVHLNVACISSIEGDDRVKVPKAGELQCLPVLVAQPSHTIAARESTESLSERTDNNFKKDQNLGGEK